MNNDYNGVDVPHPHKRKFKHEPDRVPVLARDHFVKIEIYFFGRLDDRSTVLQ